MENYPDFEKLALVIQHSLQGFILKNIEYESTGQTILVMHLSAAIAGGDPGDIRENSAGFAGFCCHCLARERGIGPLLHFGSKIHGERPAGFVTSPPS